jgi:hypothetical protein
VREVKTVNILELLKRPAEGVENLEKKLVEIAEQLPSLRAEVARIEGERSDALLGASDKVVEAIEGRLAVARRNLDRGVAAQAEIERRLAEMRARIEAERIERLRVEAEHRAREAARMFRTTYARAGREIVEALEELAEADRQAVEANRQIGFVGRVDFVRVASDRVKLMSPGGLELGVAGEISLPPWPGSHGGVGKAAQAATSISTNWSVPPKD